MAAYTREQLEHSKPLDLNLTVAIDEGSINKVVNEVYSQLSLEPHNKNKALNNLKCIILNLVNNYEEDKFLFTAIHLNEKKYIADRYNKNKISKAITKLPEKLEQSGYIYFHKGIRYPNYSRISRLLPLPKLLQLVKDKGVNPDLITHRPDTETIVCQKKIKIRGKKNKIKEDIPYQDNEEIRSFRKLMVDYNNLLNETHIDVLNQPRGGIKFGKSKSPVKVNQNKKFMRRIFSNKDFSEGGRIYGGFWQQLNSEWRSRIMIDSYPTTEVDYSGLGIQTIYDKYEIPKFKGDAYDLEPIGWDYGNYDKEELRPLLKYALMIMLNSSNYGESLYAIREKLQEEDDLFLPIGVSLQDIIEAFTKRHEPISQYFYKSMGGIQYRLDSEICAKIISYFLYEIQQPSMAMMGFQLSKQALLKENPNLKGMMMSDGKERTWEEVKAIIPEYDYGGVPILTIHDSFVIEASYEDILRWQMEAQYKLEMGVKWNKPVPTKTEWKEAAKKKHMNTEGIKWEEDLFRYEDKDKAIAKLKAKYPELEDKEPIEISIDNIAPQVRDEEIGWDKAYIKRYTEWDKGKGKLWLPDYYKLEEEPKEYIYKNEWHYIEPNKK